MDDKNMLEKKFHNAMLEVYFRAKKECNYMQREIYSWRVRN